MAAMTSMAIDGDAEEWWISGDRYGCDDVYNYGKHGYGDAELEV